jgi:hypothetical protein
MQTSAIIALLAWVSRLVLALMLVAVGWAGWIVVQNWGGIGV